MAALTAFAKLAAQWFCQFMKDLRLALSELIRFLFHGLWEQPIYIIRKLLAKKVRHNIFRTMIFVLAAYALGGALVFKCSVWAGSVYLVMLRYLLPLALTAAILAAIYNVDFIAFRLVFILVVAGLMIQTSLDTSTAAELLRHHFAATGAGLVGAISYFYLSRLEPRCSVRLLNTLSSLMYGVLFLMPASHGTKNWVYVGATSLQLTEITRLFAVISAARACTMPGKSDKQRTLIAFETVALHMVFLACVNELSTAIVILLTSVCILFLSIHQLRWPALGCAVMGFGVYAGYLVCKVCSQLGGRGFFRLGSLIYTKVITRIDPSQATDTYQLDAARKSLLLSGWFGTDSEVFVPAASSDFIIVTTIRKFGYAFFIVLLLIFFALLVWALLSINRPTFPGVLALSCITTLEIQFMLNSISALGIGPIMGLTSPFLSLGGTSLACTFFLSGILLASSSDITPAAPRFFYKRGTKNEE